MWRICILLAAAGTAAQAQSPLSVASFYNKSPDSKLLYSIELLSKDCDCAEISERQRFRPADRFRIRFSSSDGGFLYVFTKLPDGRVEKIYPEKVWTKPRLKPLAEYLVPADGWFEFEADQPEEELWLVTSKTALTEFEDVQVLPESLAAKWTIQLAGAADIRQVPNTPATVMVTSRQGFVAQRIVLRRER